MSNPFFEDDGPQPPKVLQAPLEIFANLRMLQQSNDPLIIKFAERSQRYQSYLVAADREHNLLALDELIPNDGERYLQNGESFHVEALHEGARLVWECRGEASIGELDNARCYWCPLPEQLTYHQRRNAFRVPLQEGQAVMAELAGSKLGQPLRGQLLDISATGCKLRFQGNFNDTLRSGEVYEHFSVTLPFGTVAAAVELRHLHYEARLDLTFAGMRFHHITGLEQRHIERFVYQLQREARRND